MGDSDHDMMDTGSKPDDREDSDDGSDSNNNNNDADDMSTSTEDDSDDSKEVDDDDVDDDETEEEEDTEQPDKSTSKSAVATIKKPSSVLKPALMKRPSPQASAGQLQRHPMRIKLSLKLPTKANRSEVSTTTRGSDEDESGAVMNKTDSSEAQSNKSGFSAVKKRKSSTTKRRSAHPARPIKMPTIISPGLLMTPPPGVPFVSNEQQANDTNSTQGAVVVTDKKGLTTPSQVFDHAMALAGYNCERRTENPHRGSSVTRVVGDLFDSDVKLALHFPPLAPKKLLEKTLNDGSSLNLPQVLINKLNKSRPVENSGSQRYTVDSFTDMLPSSLTMAYPDDYNEKYVNYVDLVQAREKAVKEWQDSEEDPSIDSEQLLSKIPPIPERPDPPLLSECGHQSADLEDGGMHPIYIPKASSKSKLVEHLDPQDFHITQGRYFGLRSNKVTDPNFHGPNAPALGSLTGSALSVGASSSVTALTLSSSAFLKTPDPFIAKAALYFGAKTFSASTLAAVINPIEPADGWNLKADTIMEETKSTTLGPKPTATWSDLERALQEQPDLRSVLHRAAVRAVRSGRDSESFALDKKIYSNIRHAFSLYGGMKPCTQCHWRKRGAYDCRLKRRHTQSEQGEQAIKFETLLPLFSVPIQELVTE